MLRSLSVGITGLKTFQEALSVVSNNIANSQTTGYKAQKVLFNDLLYTRYRAGTGRTAQNAGANPVSIGTGVKFAGVKTNLTNGPVTVTGGKTDVAIEGNGYFVIGDANGNQLLYTRNGAFTADRFLKTVDGYYVMGWMANPLTGELNTAVRPGVIELPWNQVAPGEVTTQAKIVGNLAYKMEIGESVVKQFPAYDSLGRKIDVTVEIIRTGERTFKYVALPNDIKETENIKNVILNTKGNFLTFGDYRMVVTPDATLANVTIEVFDKNGTLIGRKTVPNVDQNVSVENASGEEVLSFKLTKVIAPGAQETTITVGDVGTIEFDGSGKITSIQSADTAKNVPTVSFVSSASGELMNIQLDLNKITMYDTDGTLQIAEVNGNAAAMLADFSILDDGFIAGVYSDGSVRVLGQIAMAVFENPEGLERIGESKFSATVSSGEPNIIASGTGNAGRMIGNALENSNVDLAEEFVDLMVYQKAFQANTKIIQTSDEILDGVLNLIR